MFTLGNIIYTSRKVIFPPTRKMIHLLGLISVMSCDWRGYISAFHITWLGWTIRQRDSAWSNVEPCVSDDHARTRRLHVPVYDTSSVLSRDPLRRKERLIPQVKRSWSESMR